MDVQISMGKDSVSGGEIIVDSIPKNLGVNLYSVIYNRNTFSLSLINISDILHRVDNRMKRRQFMVPDFYYLKKSVKLEKGKNRAS